MLTLTRDHFDEHTFHLHQKFATHRTHLQAIRREELADLFGAVGKMLDNAVTDGTLEVGELVEVKLAASVDYKTRQKYDRECLAEAEAVANAERDAEYERRRAS